MGTTASGIWYPDGSFTINPRTIASTQASNLETVIQLERARHGHNDYASTAARDAAYTAIGGPIRGDQCTVLGAPYVYNGTAWEQFKVSSQMQAGIVATAFSGSFTTATTTLISTVTITAVAWDRVFAGHLYALASAVSNQFTLSLAYNAASVLLLRTSVAQTTVGATTVAVIPGGSTFTYALTGSCSTGTATLPADSRFNKFTYDLRAA